LDERFLVYGRMKGIFTEDEAWPGLQCREGRREEIVGAGNSVAFSGLQWMKG
jgi:hypothetical protein